MGHIKGNTCKCAPLTITNLKLRVQKLPKRTKKDKGKIAKHPEVLGFIHYFDAANMGILLKLLSLL